MVITHVPPGIDVFATEEGSGAPDVPSLTQLRARLAADAELRHAYEHFYVSLAFVS